MNAIGENKKSFMKLQLRMSLIAVKTLSTVEDRFLQCLSRFFLSYSRLPALAERDGGMLSIINSLE